jgi:hypothetical protein
MKDSQRILHANKLVVTFLAERANIEPALHRSDVHELASTMLYSATRVAQELKGTINVGISEARAYLPLDALLTVSENDKLGLRERLLVRDYLKTLPGMSKESIKAGEISHPEADITHRARMMTIFGA